MSRTLCKKGHFSCKKRGYMCQECIIIYLVVETMENLLRDQCPNIIQAILDLNITHYHQRYHAYVFSFHLESAFPRTLSPPPPSHRVIHDTSSIVYLFHPIISAPLFIDYISAFLIICSRSSRCFRPTLTDLGRIFLNADVIAIVIIFSGCLIVGNARCKPVRNRAIRAKRTRTIYNGLVIMNDQW